MCLRRMTKPVVINSAAAIDKKAELTLSPEKVTALGLLLFSGEDAAVTIKSSALTSVS